MQPTSGALLLLGLVLSLFGCSSHSRRSAEENMRLGWSQSELVRAYEAWSRSTSALSPRPAYSPPAIPKDGFVVQTRVAKVSHPAVDSPSVVGDSSEGVLEAVEGSLPGHPKLTRVVMSFDRHNPRAALQVGQSCLLHFTRDGGFFGYDMLEPHGPSAAPAP